jgi:hypothetical protein
MIQTGNLTSMSQQYHCYTNLLSVFATESTKRTELKCQCCAGLKLELNKITIELKSASKVIEILKEELRIADALSGANTSFLRNNEKDSQIHTSKRNWIQVQINQYKKASDKFKEDKESYFKKPQRGQ